MVVMMLTRVPASLRGELSRWMLEPHTGVFVGRVSARVREKLWSMARSKAPDGYGVVVCGAQNEQGFRLETYGEGRREIVDVEGLQLVRIPESPRRAKERGPADQ
jgi:CRISPR-associated protein Cas2